MIIITALIMLSFTFVMYRNNSIEEENKRSSKITIYDPKSHDESIKTWGDIVPTEPTIENKTEENMPKTWSGAADIEALKQQYKNNEVVGTLTLEGTTIIDKPIMQHSDNKYYLNHTEKQKGAQRGALFLDYENTNDFSNLNSIIYGHNQRDGTMFHDIKYFESKEYWKNHKYITTKTISGEIKWEIFSFMIASTDFSYINVNLDEDEFGQLIKDIKEKSSYDTGIEVLTTDRILSLSTCPSENIPNQRIVVTARQITE